MFRDVAQYGQERDTAKLAVTSTSSEAIHLSLTDDMDDALFDFPLTVKLRLPDAWKGCSATQGGRGIQTRIVDHEGATFALIQAIPDRGEVVLRATLSTSTLEERDER